jgi:hypothetical protein
MLGFPVTSESTIANAVLFQIKTFSEDFYLTRDGDSFSLQEQKLHNDIQSAIDTQLFFYLEDTLASGQALVNIPSLVANFNGNIQQVPITLSKGRLYNVSYFKQNGQNEQTVIAEDFNVLSSKQNRQTRNVYLQPWIQPAVKDTPFITTSIVFETQATGVLKRLYWRINPIDSSDNGIGLQIMSNDPTAAFTVEASGDTRFYWEMRPYPLDVLQFELSPFAPTNVSRLISPTDPGTVVNIFDGAALNIIATNPWFPAPATPFDFTNGNGHRDHTLSAGVSVPQFLQFPCMHNTVDTNGTNNFYGGIFSVNNGNNGAYPPGLSAECKYPGIVYDWEMVDFDIKQFNADAATLSVALSNVDLFPLRFVFLEDNAGNKLDVFNIIHSGDPSCQFILGRAEGIPGVTPDSAAGLNDFGSNLQPTDGPFVYTDATGIEKASGHLNPAPLETTSQITDQGHRKAAVNPTVWKPLQQITDRFDYAVTWRLAPIPDAPVIDMQQMDFAFGGGRADIADQDVNNFFRNRLFFPWMRYAIVSTDHAQMLVVDWSPTGNITDNDYRLNWVDATSGFGVGATQILGKREGIFNIVMKTPSPYMTSWFASRYNLDEACCVPLADSAAPMCSVIKDEFGNPLLRQTDQERTQSDINAISDPISGATFGLQADPTTHAVDVFMQSFCNCRIDPTEVISCRCMFPKPSGFPGLPAGRDFCFDEACWSGLSFMPQSLLDNRQVCDSKICLQSVVLSGSSIFYRGEQTASCDGTVSSVGTLQDNGAPETGTVSDTVGPSSTTYSDGEFQLVVALSVGLILLVLGTLLIVVMIRKGQTT